MLRGEWLENVREMGSFRLWRNAHAFRSVAGEARLGIHARLGDPNRVIFFDGSLNRALQPLPVSLEIRPIQLVVNLKGHVCEERWLGAREVIGPTAVEDLVVMLDLKDEVVDKALGHLNLTIDEKSEGDEVRIPIVQLLRTMNQSTTSAYG